MTDNDIIKALKCCKRSDPSACFKCPMGSKDGGDEVCTDKLAKCAYDLITRQKAEIEKQNNDLRIWKDFVYRETGYVKIAKVDAIKEFADRLKPYIVDGMCYVTETQIDNLAKEMTGGVK